jgi:plasmid stabilization system protein ParE
VARDDLHAIVDYVADDDVVAALSVLRKIEDAAGSLTTTPARGRVVPELAGVGVQSYRELIVPPWRLVYRVAGRSVYVLGVFDGRRNMEDVLLERFVR